jgi:hypothetical protein
MTENAFEWASVTSRDVRHTSAYEAEADMTNIPADFR